MIKINLALRKQSSAASSDIGTSATRLFEMGGERLKGVPIRKIAIYFAVGAAANWWLQSYMATELDSIDTVTAKMNVEQAKLRQQLEKTAGYQNVKKSLEADELAIRTKIETIQKLMANRQYPAKVLMAFSSSTPKEVWMDDLTLTDKGLTVHGFAIGFNPISEFMKNLSETTFVSELTLGSSQTVKDEFGADIASFDLSAKRR